MKVIAHFPWGKGTLVLLLAAFCVGAAMVARQMQWQNEGPLFTDLENKGSSDDGDVVFPEMLSRSAGPNIQSLISARDLFSPLPEEKVTAVVPPQVVVPPMVMRYKILGIMMDAAPMVILEDVQSRQSTIVQQGQKINDVTVESIQADRVILNVQGQKQELMR